MLEWKFWQEKKEKKPKKEKPEEKDDEVRLEAPPASSHTWLPNWDTWRTSGAKDFSTS